MSNSFVREIVHVEEVGSTSDLARELVTTGDVSLPLLVRADRQTHGRGRGSNLWWSSEGSLTFTLALDPAAYGLTLAHQTRLSLVAALAVIQAIKNDIPPCHRLGIRWPNDIEVDGRKLAGILPERIETSHGARVLIGVGLNMRTRFENAPDEVRAMAASLVEWNDGIDPVSLVADWLTRFESLLSTLIRNDSLLDQTWNLLNTLRNQDVRIDLGTHIVSGIARGIDPDGALLVETPEEMLRLFGGRVLREC